jgi:hypothetical protein
MQLDFGERARLGAPFGAPRAEHVRPGKALNGGMISRLKVSREARLTAPGAGALPNCIVPVCSFAFMRSRTKIPGRTA